jgi:hypothetical protein
LGSANLKRGGEGRRKLDWKALWKPALVTFAGLGAAALAFALALMWGRRVGMTPNPVDLAPPAPVVIFKTNWVDQVVHITNVVNWLKREEPAPQPAPSKPEAPPPPPPKLQPKPEVPLLPEPVPEAPKPKSAKAKKVFHDQTYIVEQGDIELTIEERNGRGYLKSVDPKVRAVVVKVPDGVYGIASGVFANCRKLEEVWLPDSLRVIAPKAFTNCPKLEMVNLPYHIKTVDREAFKNCNRNLKVLINRKHKIFYVDTDGVVRDRKHGWRVGIFGGEP